MSEQADQPVYAGFWLRLVASLIDTVVASAVLWVVAMILFGDADVDLTNLQAMLQRLTWETVVSAMLVVCCWMYFAATPGKMVFNAHIVDAGTLRRASTRQLVIRYLGYFVDMFALGLGFLWIGVDRRKQGWHDKMAGTVVIIGKPADEVPTDAQ